MPLRVTRRQALQSAALALAAGALPASAQTPSPIFTPPAPALTSAPPRGLAAVVAALGSGVGVYVGNGKFVHASSRRSGGVRVDSLHSGYYRSAFRGARRVR